MTSPSGIKLRSLALDFIVTVAIVVAGSLVYDALAQAVLHDHDVYGIVRGYVRGNPAFYQHPFNTPWLYRLADFFGTPDMLAHDRLQRACAIATACALAVFFVAARMWGQSKNRALLTTALVGCTPGVLYFGTVVELVPLGLLASAGAFLGFIALERFFPEGPRALFCAAVLGVTTATGAMTHATLHLLVLVLAGLLLTGWTQATPRPLCNRSWGLRAAMTGVLGGVHAASFTLLNLASGEGLATAQRQTAYVAIGSRDLGAAVDRFASVSWFEWFWPMAPISVLLLLPMVPGLPRWCRAAHAIPPKARWTTVMISLAVLGYLTVSAVVLVDPTGTVPVVYERGAYLLPVVFPAATLVTSFASVRTSFVALGIAAGLALVQRAHPDKEWPDTAFAQSALELRAQAPAHFLVAMYEEYDPLFRRDPLVPLWGAGEVVQSTRARKPDFTPEELALWFDYNVGELRRQHGRILITSGAMQEFRDYQTAFAWLADTHIPNTYRMTPVRHGAFDGFELLPPQ